MRDFKVLDEDDSTPAVRPGIPELPRPRSTYVPQKPSKHDSLGDRMKRYEAPTQLVLPRRTYTVMRIDGRAFHTWTRGLTKPYDSNFMSCMDAAALAFMAAFAIMAGVA